MEPTFKLDSLYNASAVVALPDGREVTVRTLTEAEVNVRDLESFKAAAAVEADLHNEETDKYKSLVGPLQRLDHEGLIAVVMAMFDITLRETVNREYPFAYIPFPEEATDEEKITTIQRREESEARIRQLRSTEFSRRSNEQRAKVAEMEEANLLANAVSSIVQTETFNARMEEFYTQTVYQSARDGDKPAFDLEVVRRHGRRDGLNDRVYQELIATYAKVDTADPWTLQKHS